MGIIKQKKAALPVVVIGNITAGGSGKTPFIEWILKNLESPSSFAVISKGYRSLAAKNKWMLSVKNETGQLLSSKIIGDEPYLLASHLPHVPIYIGPSRHKVIELSKNSGSIAAILDDGLQELSLYRDCTAILVNALNPWGDDYFLPRGRLRDTKKRLKEADLIVLNNVENQEVYEALKQQIKKITQAPVTGCFSVIEDIFCEEGELKKLPSNSKIGIICGLGSPEAFKKSLTKLNLHIIDEYTIPDHTSLSEDKLLAYASDLQMKGANCIIMSEKDFVKRQKPFKGTLPLYYTKAVLKFEYDPENCQNFLNKLENLIRKKALDPVTSSTAKHYRKS